ncbi:MAG TPA: outer membrane protein assembly factor BamD [Candidatus Dormibacteraeota bacterium]|nr:outer membrane protein assembly factor BamD [Candidatus Dormibacteraeota bacterium]
MRRILLYSIAASMLLGAIQCDAQILHRKKKINKSTDASNNAQPDKLLYDRALEDIKHGRQEVGRLGMQTLINTYPDSEYLAKAKLAIADSYYKESGTANLTQAISAYKDFGVFFPFLPEAGYAQLQVAMAHYQQMEKPDRDRTHAIAAQDEFQMFLQKYPKDPLAPKAEQHLREVQEVIAEGDYRIANYYYIKGDKRAAAARLLTITQRYPLYSRSDNALWMLGNIFETTERKDIAGAYYGSIVRNYPLSKLVPNAKDKLTAFKVPIPQPDPKALAWMVAEQNTPHPRESLIRKPLGMFRTGPGNELRIAVRNGAPNLEPEADTISATDILTGGNHSTIGGGGSSGGSTTGIVATITPGETPATAPGASADPSMTPPGSTDAPPPVPDSASANSTPTDAEPAKAATNPDGTPVPAANKKESTSKKKKGLKKLIPF